jgi:hypothetical protein
LLLITIWVTPENQLAESTLRGSSVLTQDFRRSQMACSVSLPAVAQTACISRLSRCSVDTGGNLYIADDVDERIHRVTPDGIVTTVAGNGVAGFPGDSMQATRAALNEPLGIRWTVSVIYTSRIT